MIIKDVSMNYLYVSHPIFVKLYGKVVGFSGTLGNKYDKKIYMEQYDLTTMKIARENVNLRLDLPILLRENIDERNLKIAQEVVYFHKKEIHALVIFKIKMKYQIYYTILIQVE